MTKRKSKGDEKERSSLIVPLEEAESGLDLQIQRGETLLQAPIKSFEHLSEIRSEVKIWRDYSAEYLMSIASNSALSDEFTKPTISVSGLGPAVLAHEIKDLHSRIRRDIDRLRSIRQRLPLLPTEISEGRKIEPAPILEVERLLRRFHLVARQIRSRYEGRPTLDINDEYDVQDLLLALLRIIADDVRTEEWTPSYAGGSARMDILLKKEQIVIEVKKTRQGLSDRKIGDQLIEDIARYAQHQDAKTLICFVYDPEGRIVNPGGLELDLSHLHDNLSVRVIVSPKGQ